MFPSKLPLALRFNSARQLTLSYQELAEGSWGFWKYRNDVWVYLHDAAAQAEASLALIMEIPSESATWNDAPYIVEARRTLVADSSALRPRRPAYPRSGRDWRGVVLPDSSRPSVPLLAVRLRLMNGVEALTLENSECPW